MVVHRSHAASTCEEEHLLDEASLSVANINAQKSLVEDY